MQVVNKSSYISTIYSAIVVNTNKDLDPDNRDRIQIYIPSVNYKYANNFIEYMNSDNKKANIEIFNALPWAVTLIDGLNVGDEVYGSYIDGDGTQYVILGVSKSKKTIDTALYTNSIFSSINGSSIADMAMPIIMYNEIGVPLSAWSEDSIPDNMFRSITLHDGGTYDSNSGRWIRQGCWAIGLIQWNGVRAYDTCYEIAKEDTNWKSYFTTECDLKSSLTASLNAGNTVNQRSKFSLENGWNPEKGGPVYNAISNLLNSSASKTVQKRLAYDDTAETINMLQEASCTNPAILIYLADFYNQYGKYLSETTRKATEACNQGGTMITQLDWLINNQLKPNFSTFNTYSNRRNATYNYVVDLYNNGSFNTTLTGEGSTGSDIYISGTGQYCMPVRGHIFISAGYGIAKNAGGQGYTSSSHNGIDFAIAIGTPIYACTSGYAQYKTTTGGFGKHVFIYADDGNLLVFGHMSAFAGNDRQVVKGEVIGYVGSTGNSSGPHVHLGITDASNGEAGLWNANIRSR